VFAGGGRGEVLVVVDVDVDAGVEAAGELLDDGVFGLLVEGIVGDDIPVEFVEVWLGDTEPAEAFGFAEDVDEGEGVHAFELVALAGDDLVGGAALDFG